MKVYKSYNKTDSEAYALPHIVANGIRCRFYGWAAMAGDVDVLKIDGRFRRFDITTHREIKR